MRRHSCLGTVPVMAAALLVTAPGSARAEVVCETPDAFNSYAAMNAFATTDGTLTFTVTGVSLVGVDKHHLAQLNDTRDVRSDTLAPCTGIDFKTWGFVALAADQGTVKDELFNQCCETPCAQCAVDRGGLGTCEVMAGPRPSPVIFSDPSQVCDILLWFDPQDFGYDILCTPGGHLAFDEPNKYSVQINQITFPVAAVATVSNEQFCYVRTPTSQYQITVPVLEDVTASPNHEDVVYPLDADLALSTGDGEIYLKFDLSAVEGRVTQARVFLHASVEGSANGDGGDFFVVADNSWSELTLTWNNRPPVAGAALDRIAGVTANQWHSADVSAAVSDPAVYSFALVPQATDTNGAHFDAKERPDGQAAYLQITYVVEDNDADGHPDGPDCDDTDPDVHPGATERCNGIDDDCDDEIDEGCAPDSDAGTGADAGPDAGSGNDAGSDPGSTSGGCSCRTGAPVSTALLWLLALLWLVRRRQRRL